MNAKQENRKKNTLKIVYTAVYLALLLAMAFIPFIGYIKVGPLSITLLTIPITLAAMTVGWKTSTFLGLVFGVTSLIQCFGMDAFGVFLWNINPVYTAIMCLVPRILDGLLTGLVYKFLQSKNETVARIVTGFCGAAFNTVFFLTALYLLFAANPEFVAQYGQFNLFTLITVFAGVNGIIEVVASTVICPVLGRVLTGFIKKGGHRY